MNKKTAQAIAKKAAFEAYNLTLRKLAQQAQEDGKFYDSEYGGGTAYDRSRNTGGEVTYQPRGAVNKPTYERPERGNNYFTQEEKDMLQGEQGATRSRDVDPEYQQWYDEVSKSPFPETGLEGDPLAGFADDGKKEKEEDDDKCPKCGCVCKDNDDKKKKEASRKLQRIAAKYARAMKK